MRLVLPCPGTFYITCFGWCILRLGYSHPLPWNQREPELTGIQGTHGQQFPKWLIDCIAACTMMCTYCLLSPRERLHFLYLCCKLPWRFSVNRWCSDTTKGNEYPKYIRKSFLQIIRSTLFNQGFYCNARQSYAVRKWWYQAAISLSWVRSTSWVTGWTFIRCGICTFSSKMNHSGLV